MAERMTNAQLARKSRPDLNQDLWEQMAAADVAGYFVREYVFSPPGLTWRMAKTTFGTKRWAWQETSKKRQWRFDFAALAQLIALEIQGSTFVVGRHSRGAGMAGDMLKANYENLWGWKLLTFDSNMVRHGIALDIIKRALAGVER